MYMARGPGGPPLDTKFLAIMLSGFMLGVTVTVMMAYSGGLPGLISGEGLANDILNMLSIEFNETLERFEELDNRIQLIINRLDALDNKVDAEFQRLNTQVGEILRAVPAIQADINKALSELRLLKDGLELTLQRLNEIDGALDAVGETLNGVASNVVDIQSRLQELADDVAALLQGQQAVMNEVTGIGERLDQHATMTDQMLGEIGNMTYSVEVMVVEMNQTLYNMSEEVSMIWNSTQNIEFKSRLVIKIEAAYIFNISDPYTHRFIVSLETVGEGPDDEIYLSNVYVLGVDNYNVTVTKLPQPGLYEVVITLPVTIDSGDYVVVFEAEKTIILPDGETEIIRTRKLKVLKVI